MGAMIRVESEERRELLLELTHVLGQLQACSKPEVVQPFIDELTEVALQLLVPADQRRADAVAFLDEPENIASASWAQCGGLLYALCNDHPDNSLQLAIHVAQRLVQLASRQGQRA